MTKQTSLLSVDIIGSDKAQVDLNNDVCELCAKVAEMCGTDVVWVTQVGTLADAILEFLNRQVNIEQMRSCEDVKLIRSRYEEEIGQLKDLVEEYVFFCDDVRDCRSNGWSDWLLLLKERASALGVEVEI